MNEYSGLKAAPFGIYGYTDPLSIISLIYRSHFIRDRFNILNKYSPYKVSEEFEEIPTPFTDSYTLTDIMDSRAKELLGSNNVVMVAWSGGVDSTAVVVALLKNCPEAERNRIKIVFNEQSINENPNFYKYLITCGVTMIQDEMVTDILREEECDVVTSGWCADQLFGSDINLQNPDLYHVPFMDGITWHIEKRLKAKLSNKSKAILTDIYLDYANKLGIKLEQFCQFAWMFNFGCKWTTIKSYKQFALAGTINYDKLTAFYDTLDFQRYALSRQDVIAQVNPYQFPMQYKLPLKQYIFEYDKNQEYLTSKTKIGSWRGIYATSANYKPGLLVLTDNGMQYYTSKDVKENCGYCKAKLTAAVQKLYLKDEYK